MIASRPLVSIAVATYNGHRFLRQQLDSIYAQTYPNIEVVVSDDRSSDETVAILDDYRRKRGLIYRVNETNLGYARNFEKAASMCNGAYVAFSDQDDIFLPRKIETLVREIARYSLIYSDAALIDAAGTTLAPSYMRYVNFPMLTGKPFRELVFNCFIRGFQVLFCRDLLQAALPMPQHLTHDDWFTLLAAKRDGILYLDEPLVHYRQHGENVTGSLRRFSAAGEFIGAIRNFFDRQAHDCRKRHYGRVLDKLDSMLRSAAFEDSEKAFISDVRRYYRNQLDSVVHWRSFLIALRHYRVIAPQRSAAFKARFLLASLLHP